MKRQRLQAATVGGSPDEVEQAFYEALNNADMAQLMGCWAEEDEIVCVMPAGDRLVGAASIRKAFEALFARGKIQVRPERIHKIEALASVVHHLTEQVHTHSAAGEQAFWVTVTHVYHKTPQGWRLVAHHASPATAQDRSGAARQPPMLH